MSSASPDKRLGVLTEVPLEIEAERERLSVSLQSLLDLRPGSTVALSRGEDEPVEIYVGGVPIARGRIVAGEGKSRIEVTEVGSVK